MQSIKIKVDFFKNKEVEPAELVQMNIYESNTYRQDLNWLHFDDEQSIQERQQMKDQPSCISIFVAYPTIPSSNLNDQQSCISIFVAYQAIPSTN